MYSIKSEYLGDLRVESVHLKSNSTITTDAPIDNHGKGEKFSPTDMVCSALASCMLTIMGIKARDMNLDIKGIEIEIEKIMVSNPRRIHEVKLHFLMPKSYTEKEKVILENAAKICPVALSLSENTKQTITFQYQ